MTVINNLVTAALQDLTDEIDFYLSSMSEVYTVDVRRCASIKLEALERGHKHLMKIAEELAVPADKFKRDVPKLVEGLKKDEKTG